MILLLLLISSCVTLVSEGGEIYTVQKCWTRFINDTDDKFDMTEFLEQQKISSRRCEELYGKGACLTELKRIGWNRWLAKCRRAEK